MLLKVLADEETVMTRDSHWSCVSVCTGVHTCLDAAVAYTWKTATSQAVVHSAAKSHVGMKCTSLLQEKARALPIRHYSLMTCAQILRSTEEWSRTKSERDQEKTEQVAG